MFLRRSPERDGAQVFFSSFDPALTNWRRYHLTQTFLSKPLAVRRFTYRPFPAPVEAMPSHAGS